LSFVLCPLALRFFFAFLHAVRCVFRHTPLVVATRYSLLATRHPPTAHDRHPPSPSAVTTIFGLYAFRKPRRSRSWFPLSPSIYNDRRDTPRAASSLGIRCSVCVGYGHRVMG
jgi:hypothetical protein